MLSVWLLSVVLFVWMLRYIFWNFRSNTEHVLPPMFPGAVPLLGHAHLLLGDTEKLLKTILEFAAESLRQGGVCTMLIGTKIHYMVTDPDDALTAANACLQKHFAYDFAKAWLGDGLITGSGETWKRHRKLLNPAFRRPVVNGFLEVFNDQAKLLVKDFDVHVGMGAFDHTAYLRNRALETFCLTAFGIDTVDSKFTGKYMSAVDKMLSLITTRFQKLHLQNDLLYKLLGYKREEQETIKALNDMSNEILQMKRASKNGIKKNHEKKYKPLLDLLLDLSDADTLSDAEIRQEVDTAIVAGFDTTSNALVNILAILGHYPEVQQKVYEEYIEVVGPERDIKEDDLGKLVYTAAVIKEALRMFPIVPGLMRYVEKDVKLKNYTMRAGSQCLLLSPGTHHHAIWGDDSDQFKPERWLNVTVPDESIAFGAFSWGRRTCIGKTFAMTSMKVTLGHCVRRYRVIGDITHLRFNIHFVMKAISGHEVIIERRN